MKAAWYERYGGPENVSIRDVPKPVPREHEVLVRVHAVSLNGSDWEGLTGRPAYARIGGLFRPRRKTLGSDIAGTVESVGAKVSRFKAGDEVFGDILTVLGGLAEYARAPEKALAHKPAGLSFEDAATIPQAGVIALQAMRDAGKVQPGHKVLINGAGGSGGSWAIQFAKLYGAEVTGVDNAGKLDFMRELGAAHVIDYRREDFTRTGAEYDMVLDFQSYGRSPADYARALRPGGSYFFVGGALRSLFKILAGGPFVRMRSGKRVRIFVARPNTADILEVARLCETGEIRPIVDQRFPLDEAAEALGYAGEGRAKGKVVILPGRAALQPRTGVLS